MCLIGQGPSFLRRLCSRTDQAYRAHSLYDSASSSSREAGGSKFAAARFFLEATSRTPASAAEEKTPRAFLSLFCSEIVGQLEGHVLSAEEVLELFLELEGRLTVAGARLALDEAEVAVERAAVRSSLRTFLGGNRGKLLAFDQKQTSIQQLEVLRRIAIGKLQKAEQVCAITTNRSALGLTATSQAIGALQADVGVLRQQFLALTGPYRGQEMLHMDAAVLWKALLRLLGPQEWTEGLRGGWNIGS